MRLPISDRGEPQGRGTQVVVSGSRLADVELVAVVAIHEIGIGDLQREQVWIVREGDEIIFRCRQEGSVLIHEPERVEPNEPEKGSFGNSWYMKDEYCFLAVE